MPRALSLTARTLYAELRELAIALGTTENLAGMPGGFVTKTLHGNPYLYYQYRDLDGRTKQVYIGPDDETTGRLAKRIREHGADLADDLERIEELRGAFVAAGGFVTEHAPLKVLKGFADAGLLGPARNGIVLVGTHAFNALGNLLGTRWDSQVQTQDIDLAGASVIDLAVSRSEIAVPDVLEQLGMGFLPVPALDARLPSTSYRVRGQDLRVDLLTPLVGKPPGRPVPVPALNAPAQPVRFLDYLIEVSIPAVIVGRRMAVLVNVPLPERFALHKLLVSESRTSAFATKARKDRIQAMQLLQVLEEEAPDTLPAAKAELIRRGKGWSDRLERALGKCRPLAPELIGRIEAL